MYHYRRNLMIFSVLLLLLGLLRTVSFVQQMGSWMELFKMDNIDMVKLVLLFLCDLLTSIGAVVSGVMGILLRKKDKGLIVWSILSFVVCIAFFANAMLIIVNSNASTAITAAAVAWPIWPLCLRCRGCASSAWRRTGKKKCRRTKSNFAHFCKKTGCA